MQMMFAGEWRPSGSSGSQFSAERWTEGDCIVRQVVRPDAGCVWKRTGWGAEMKWFKPGSLATVQLADPQRLIKSSSGSWCFDGITELHWQTPIKQRNLRLMLLLLHWQENCCVLYRALRAIFVHECVLWTEQVKGLGCMFLQEFQKFPGEFPFWGIF